MKKFSALLLSMIIAAGTCFSVFGAEGKIVNGKTMVPVRGVFEELGFTVQWDNATATATISDGTYTVEVPKGKTYFTVNNQSIKPDVPQQVINGSLYLPLRAIGDAVGAATSWNDANKMAHISYNGKDVYVKCSATNNNNTTNAKRSVIGDPHIFDSEYVKGFYYKKNSVDGVTVGLLLPYYGEKTIKYATMNFTFYNAVGDLAYDTIDRHYRYSYKLVGPMDPKDPGMMLDGIPVIPTAELVGYFTTLDKVVLDSVDLEYMDGTKEHIVSGVSTTTDIDEYYHELSEEMLKN